MIKILYILGFRFYCFRRAKHMIREMHPYFVQKKRYSLNCLNLTSSSTYPCVWMESVFVLLASQKCLSPFTVSQATYPLSLFFLPFFFPIIINSIIRFFHKCAVLLIIENVFCYFIYCWYPFSRHIFYKPDSTKPNFLVGSIHVLYFILFF